MNTYASLPFLLAVLLFNMETAKSQWYYSKLPTSNYLYSLSFPEVSTGYVCGEYHTLLKTMDGGATWNSLNINTGGNLLSIKFTSSITGYVATNRGEIFKTIDGGQNWILIKQVIEPSFTCSHVKLWFINSDTGFVVCDSTNLEQRIFRTLNGGATWESQVPPGFSGYNPGSIMFLNDSIGFISFNGSLIKTTNMGVTWDVVTLGLSSYRSIFFLDEQHGFGAYTGLDETLDGGVNWNWLVFGDNLFSYVWFPSADTGYTCEDSDFYFTADTGKTWNPMILYNFYPGYWNHRTEMCFTDSKHGFAVGDGGTFYKLSWEGAGIENKNSNPRIELIQNPVTDAAIRFKVNYSLNDGTLAIYTLQGQEIFKIEHIGSKIVEINRAGLKPGIYFYKYSDESNYAITGKIILE